MRQYVCVSVCVRACVRECARERGADTFVSLIANELLAVHSSQCPSLTTRLKHTLLSPGVVCGKLSLTVLILDSQASSSSRFISGLKFWKILYIVTLFSKYTRALNFENFCQLVPAAATLRRPSSLSSFTEPGVSTST